MSVSYLVVGYYNILAVDPLFSAEGPLHTDLFEKFRIDLPKDQSGILNSVAALLDTCLSRSVEQCLRRWKNRSEEKSRQ